MCIFEVSFSSALNPLFCANWCDFLFTCGTCSLCAYYQTHASSATAHRHKHLIGSSLISGEAESHGLHKHKAIQRAGSVQHHWLTWLTMCTARRVVQRSSPSRALPYNTSLRLSSSSVGSQRNCTTAAQVEVAAVCCRQTAGLDLLPGGCGAAPASLLSTGPYHPPCLQPFTFPPRPPLFL